MLGSLAMWCDGGRKEIPPQMGKPFSSLLRFVQRSLAVIDLQLTVKGRVSFLLQKAILRSISMSSASLDELCNIQVVRVRKMHKWLAAVSLGGQRNIYDRFIYFYWIIALLSFSIYRSSRVVFLLLNQQNWIVVVSLSLKRLSSNL